LAKRIFELAKEMDLPSKMILEKCQAEGIPNMKNHMASVSAGLEATIREWFASSQEDSSVATAVETAEKVDLTKIKAQRKAKARKKPGGEDEHDDSEDAEAETPAPAAAPEDKPAPVAAPPVSTPAPEAKAAPQAAPPAAPSIPSSPAPIAPAPPPPTPAPSVRPAAEAPSAPKPAGGPAAPPARPGEARERPKPEPVKREESRGEDDGSPEMNVPRRPKDVKPAGPKLVVQKPVKLSGPKVIRVEAPETDLPTMRRSAPMGPGQGQRGGPRTGGPMRSGGGGTFGPGPGGGPDDSRGHRNRRRATPGGAGAAPAAPPAKRGGGKDDASRYNWREQDLAEREERLARAGGFIRQRRRDAKRSDHVGDRAQTAAQTGGVVKIVAPFTIKDLSSATGIKASEIIKKLFMQGVIATVNSGIEPEKAQEIMIEYNIDLQFTAEQSAEEALSEELGEREAIDLRPRSPVVTILGHVDHGKTSLLDRIRSANVAAGEAGGITQATSAFRVPVQVAGETKHVVFFDTPGHEAFTAMRARGANITDIVVLVIAADDGVMPQTVESINHAKAAGAPIVVALNKIDKPEATDANIQKILGQLAEKGLNPTEWGGDVEVVRTSAAKGTGITELLETLDYQAQLMELTADFEGPARGTVVEAKIDEGRGPTASVLVENGSLRVGDFIVAGRAFGRVRDIVDDRGTRLKVAEPSMPVRVSGLDEVPDAGDRFFIVESLKTAQEAAEQRRHRDRERELAQPKATLDSILSQLKEGETKELRIVVKADVQGSVDVLRKSIEDVSTSEVKVRVLHAAVGGINESDVLLSAASQAIIIGFNVIASGATRQLAEQKDVEIRPYQVIYEILDDIRSAAEGLLAPELRQEVLGHAEVRQVFRVTRVGAVAGCYITDGTVERNALVRVTRGGIVIENDRVLEQLKRFKDDAKDVRAGQECGMKIAGYDDIKEGDVIECYRRIEVKRSLTAPAKGKGG